MRSLLSTLLDHDPGLLAIIARRWDVDLDGLERLVAAEMLAAVMLDADKAAAEWSRLADNERGALQMLISAPDYRMAETQFARLFGQLRQMGPGRRDREKPHLNPTGVFETLYYRGLVAVAVAQSKTGMQPFVYVPDDLAAVFPAHETGFDLQVSAEDAAAAAAAQVTSPDIPGAIDMADTVKPETTQSATTTLVDDLTTLLAFLQVETVLAEKDALRQQVSDGLAAYWLGDTHPARVALLIALAGGMGLASSEGDRFKPVPANARRWLELTRPRQVRTLAEAWRDSTHFNDLWHTPGLQPEPTRWHNDPLLARQTVLVFLEVVPPEDWWPVDQLIALVKAEEPDFQRPAGDYDSWYIRDASTGDYLRGFESWDRVDGAVLRFILTGPMHWLGLVDLGEGGKLCRLTAYGRAFGNETEWPDPPEDPDHPAIQPDGTIHAPRTLSRYERFQLARIAEWHAAGPPYEYAITAAALERAAQQDIPVSAIRAFLQRISGADLPESVRRMLDQWEQGGAAAALITSAVILRTGDADTLTTILETPDLRRFVGAQLGPTAVIVRAGQEDALAAALHQYGILVETDE
ncbi:MAG: helicase-associated domain-containing protein [Anaerolineae bacterium]|nr:helicase-associated domain-containing protein [Anaerolineae bacterium]